MGYQPTVHENAINLYGYQGDKRKQVAHIVIPRSQVGGASNDVGFEKVGDGYILHLSAYDKTAKTFNVNKLKQLYSKYKIDKFIKNNMSRFKKKSMTVDQNGKIKIRISARI